MRSNCLLVDRGLGRLFADDDLALDRNALRVAHSPAAQTVSR
jgi:hypothetical protein